MARRIASSTTGSGEQLQGRRDALALTRGQSLFDSVEPTQEGVESGDEKRAIFREDISPDGVRPSRDASGISEAWAREI